MQSDYLIFGQNVTIADRNNNLTEKRDLRSKVPCFSVFYFSVPVYSEMSTPESAAGLILPFVRSK